MKLSIHVNSLEKVARARETPLKKWREQEKLPWKSGVNDKNSLEKVARARETPLKKWREPFAE
ncbi:MAG: hypothetical protein SPL67_01885 [Prevotella sp.]|nr:hypothetical protein [Prevotella sp.]